MSDTFGQKLKTWRESAGISQAELARRIDASATWVSNLERDFSPTAKGGKPQPSVETCDKIAHALGVRLAEVRIAAGYAPPGKPESWLSQKPDISDQEKEREAEAERTSEMIANWMTMTPEEQVKALAIHKILRSNRPELLKILGQNFEYVDLEKTRPEKDDVITDTDENPH